MKSLKYLLILPLLIGCNSKNNSIEVLKANKEAYVKTANTYAYNSNTTIVFANFDGKKIDFTLIEKEQDDNIDIVECKIGKKVYTPVSIDSDSDKLFVINLEEEKDNINIKCKLSNDETMRFKMRKY